MSTSPSDTDLKTTPLTEAHIAAGARMVEFAGYSMPVQYKDGVLKEHLWTREHCGLFDVSHMGPAFLRHATPTEDDVDLSDMAALVEPLICGELGNLAAGRQKYSLLMADDGGILDDLMIGRPAGTPPGVLYMVVNAGTKEADFDRVAEALGEAAWLDRRDDGALIAVQGPKAAAVVAAILPETAAMKFMDVSEIKYEGRDLVVSRSGYTGEDGFEILVPCDLAVAFWNRLAADERAKPIGLGARDSLRLEAGLPLYGHDIDETRSPVEADLGFAVSKKRLKAGGIAGADRLAAERKGALSRVRVGLRVLEGAPAREGAEIADAAGAVIGKVTSGGFSPSFSAPIAMGYVPPALAAPGTALKVIVRGKAQAAEVTALPFVPHNYVRS
ncbi:MAG: glycine cleavage system aminomethyltransferase GcvT [Caulobacteraceae bacterium]